MVDPKKITARLDENHKFFEEINRVYKHGNIQDELGNEFDKELVKQIAASKKKSLPWHENLTYDLVKASQDKLRKKLDNPLEIADSGISAYHNAPIEYTFGEDLLLFVRCDGETKSKQRRKNILIFNPDLKDEVTISIDTNIYVKFVLGRRMCWSYIYNFIKRSIIDSKTNWMHFCLCEDTGYKQ